MLITMAMQVIVRRISGAKLPGMPRRRIWMLFLSCGVGFVL